MKECCTFLPRGALSTVVVLFTFFDGAEFSFKVGAVPKLPGQLQDPAITARLKMPHFPQLADQNIRTIISHRRPDCNLTPCIAPPQLPMAAPQQYLPPGAAEPHRLSPLCSSVQPTSPLTSLPSTPPPLPEHELSDVVYDLLDDTDGSDLPDNGDDIPESGDATRLEGDPASLQSHIPRAAKLSELQKLRHVMNTLRRWRWTPATLLRTLAQHREAQEFRLRFKEFQNFAYMEVMTGELCETIPDSCWENILDAQGWQRMAAVLKSELNTLISESPAFQAHQKNSLNKNSDFRSSIDTLIALQPDIEQHAPQWVRLLDDTTEKKRPQQRQSQSKSPVVGPNVVILSILTHRLQPIKSTNFATLMGLYLYQGGARRRVIDTTARLGLSRSYKTIHRLLGDLSETQRQQVRAFGKNPATQTAYDNYDFAVGRRGERAGDQREHRSIVTALSFNGQCIPESGLQQAMWHPEIPLSSVAFVRGLKRDSIWLNVRSVPHCKPEIVS